MKTTIVQYVPRGERSNTKVLVDYFITLVKGDKIVEDISVKPPPMFDSKNIGLYFKKYYLSEKLTPAEEKQMSEFHRLVEQVKATNFLVVAFPMYNFSLPAAVKAYFDAIALNKETWYMDAKGYHPLLKGKKAVIITTSGGDYAPGTPYEKADFAAPLAKNILEFLGFEVEVVRVDGVNMYEDKKEQLMKTAKEKLHSIAKKFYG